MSILKNIKAAFKARKIINETWRLPRNFERIATYFRLVNTDAKGKIVDDRTWYDLDMEAVYCKIDTTITGVGRQFLYNRMRTFSRNESQLAENIIAAELLNKNKKLKVQLKKALSIINDEDGVAVTNILFTENPPIELSRKSLFWSVFCILLLTASIVSPSFILVSIPIILTNFVFAQRLEKKTQKLVVGIYFLHKLVKTFNAIAHSDVEHGIVDSDRNKLQGLQAKLFYLAHGQGGFSFLTGYISYFINLLCLYEYVLFAYFYKHVSTNISLLRSCYSKVGELDSNLALASYFDDNRKLCQAKFNNYMHINVVDIYHPLIENSVSNSFNNYKMSGMITGSNMAGKTSFIKTIGVNYLLARTFGISHAENVDFPLVDLYSSIKTSDSIELGKSYYFAELDRINEFLNVSKDSEKCLFLIDEIYRGTNTVERIAGAAAVLEALADASIVLVTTHDIELKKFLENQYRMWYFEESGNLDMPYDYRLRAGVCESRNALKLMERVGYPTSIIDRAKAIAAKGKIIE